MVTTRIASRVGDEFASLYGGAPELLVRSPGRVNLIGDHTDYNDGLVMPIAIEQAIWIAAAPRSDCLIDVTSLERGRATLDLEALHPARDWSDCVAGTLQELEFVREGGFDAVIGSEIPQGAGLSSSAALEIGIARVAAEIHGWDWDPLEVAKAARRAENDFVGVPSGIMDQVVVAAGSPGHALLLDCLTLAMRHVPIAASIRVVILDTGTRRKLIQSSYRTRREECERAAAQLGVTALRDASMDSLEAGIRDDGLRRRACHVVS